MPVGFTVDKAALDSRLGDISLTLRNKFDAAEILNAWLLRTPNVEIEALGYTNQDVAYMKGAAAKWVELGVEFQTDDNTKRMYGIG